MQLFAMVELSIKLLKTGCFKVKRRSETGAKNESLPLFLIFAGRFVATLNQPATLPRRTLSGAAFLFIAAPILISANSYGFATGVCAVLGVKTGKSRSMSLQLITR
jgi:hypothetical protein